MSQNRRTGTERPNNRYPTGRSGKWHTPSRTAKRSTWIDTGGAFDVGFEGLWVTCVRGRENEAEAECLALCAENGLTIWGIKPASDGDDNDDDDTNGDGPVDIETAVAQELEDLRARKPTGHTAQAAFSVVRTGLDCVFFVRTRPPVRPVRLAEAICADAARCENFQWRKCRHLNRLSPVTAMDRATEIGILRVSREALAHHFSLSPPTPPGQDLQPSEASGDVGNEMPVPGSETTYAIRPTIRHHHLFSSDAVIKLIAGIIGPQHKVDLRNPGKVILVDLFHTYCGISVVDGPSWEALRRFNINEVYKDALAKQSPVTAGSPGDNIPVLEESA